MSHRGGPATTRRSLLRRAVGVAGAALAGSGCMPSPPGQGPAPSVFRLSPKTSFDPGLPSVAWALTVAEPREQGALRKGQPGEIAHQRRTPDHQG